MKKKISGILAILFACAIVSINSTANAVRSNVLTYQTLNDTTPPMHHQMNKSKHKMMHDSTNNSMQMSDSTNSMRDSTHR